MTEEVAKVHEGKTWRSHDQGTEKITWSRQGEDGMVKAGRRSGAGYPGKNSTRETATLGG